MGTTRKHLLLVPDTFQSRFLVIGLIHYCVIIASFLGALFLPLMFQLDSLDLPDAARGEFASEFLSLHEHVWPALVLALLLLGLHLIFFSRRIAGPLYRWRSLFRELGGGDLTVRATMRAGDYLEKEVHGLNNMIESLRTKVAELQTQHGRLRRISGGMARAMAEGAETEVRRCVEELLRELDEHETQLRQFKTTTERGIAQDDPPPSTL